MRAPIDLRVFACGTAEVPRRWRHAVRRLDCHGRVALPEAAELVGGGGSVVAALRATGGS